MEKIRNVKEWPCDIERGMLTFASGLRDPKSLVYILNQHVLDLVKYFLIVETVIERLPETVPYYPAFDGDVLLGSYHTSCSDFYRISLSMSHPDECNLKFMYWTGYHTRDRNVFGVPLLTFLAHCYLEPDDTKETRGAVLLTSLDRGVFELAKTTPKEAICEIGRHVVFVKAVKRSDVPLYMLLGNKEFLEPSKLLPCSIKRFGETVALENCRDRK